MWFAIIAITINVLGAITAMVIKKTDPFSLSIHATVFIGIGYFILHYK